MSSVFQVWLYFRKSKQLRRMVDRSWQGILWLVGKEKINKSIFFIDGPYSSSWKDSSTEEYSECALRWSPFFKSSKPIRDLHLKNAIFKICILSLVYLTYKCQRSNVVFMEFGHDGLWPAKDLGTCFPYLTQSVPGVTFDCNRSNKRLTKMHIWKLQI